MALKKSSSLDKYLMIRSYVLKTFLFLIGFAFISVQANSQECFWASVAGGSGSDVGCSVAIDQEGNTYVAGNTSSNCCYFENDTVCHGPFLVKYNKWGHEEWVFKLIVPPAGSGASSGISNVVFDSIRNQLLLTGEFSNYLIIGDTTINQPGTNSYIIKIDLNGHLIWVRTTSGSGITRSSSVAYDTEGNIYLSGSNSTNINFDRITIPRGGFLAKYNSDGDVLWAKNKFRYYAPSSTYTEAFPYTILFAGNSLIVNGTFYCNDTIVIDNTTLIFSSNFIVSSFLSSFDTSGNLIWIHDIGQPQAFPGYQICVDHLQNIYTTGAFQGKVVFGNDTLSTQLNSNQGDFYIIKYTYDGNYQWVRRSQTTNYASGMGIYATSEKINVGGYFKGVTQFGDISLTTSGTGMFVAGYTTDGNFIEARNYGLGQVINIVNDQNSNIVFTGYFEDTLTIGSIPHPSRGGYDFFTAKCSPLVNRVEKHQTLSNTLNIYANPTTGFCNITIPEAFKTEPELSLYIYDTSGKLLEKVQIRHENDKFRYSISGKSEGSYQVILTNGKQYYTGKIIFKK